ncbi:unnamed protein product [Withania somnifera]
MMKESLFQKKLCSFYNSLIFNKKDLWGNSDVVVIHSQQENSPNSVSTQFYIWLIGEQLHGTTTIFTPYGIYFFCTQKNYSKIRSLCCSVTLMRKIPVSVQLKAKNDDGFGLIDSTIRSARVIRNNKKGVFGTDDGSWPFVVGYVEGEYPKSKLFWSCLSDLESRKFKAVSVNSGVDKMIYAVHEPLLGAYNVSSFDEKPGFKSIEVAPPNHMFSPPVYAGKDKGILSTTKNVHFSEKAYQSPLLDKEKSSLESKFEHIGLSEKGRSNLGSEFDNTRLLWGDTDEGGLGKLVRRVNESPLPTTKTNENVSLMGNLNLSSSSSSGKQEKMFKFGGNCLDGGKGDNSKAGKKDGDQVFKFGASVLDSKEGKLKEISKKCDQVFKFRESKWDVKDVKSMEGNKNGDQPFKFEERKKDSDQVFKFGEGKKDDDQVLKLGEGKNDDDLQSKIGGKRGVNDVKLLTERLTAFYTSWRTYKEEQWRKADVLVISTQSVWPVETLSHPVSSAFLLWLLDNEFPETTAVFTHTGIEFLCTNESFFRLRTIGIRMTMVTKVTVSVQLKIRGEQCLDWLRKTLCQVNIAPKSGANWCPLVVGCISRESMEIGVLSRSKMFEVAYVDNALTNLLEQGNFEKPESFAAQQSTLPNQFQRLSLGICSGAKTANAVSLSEIVKMKSRDDNSYVSQPSNEEKLLLEKKGDTSSPLLIDGRVDNGGQVKRSKPEENKVLEEDNSSRKLADKMMLLEIKEGDTDTSTTEAGAEEKLSAAEQNMQSNPENSPLLQVKECGEQSKPTAEGGMDYSVQPTGVTDAAAENSLPDDNNGSPRKDSVGCDDDDWTLIEMECEGKETEVSERVSWKRWFMDKTRKSFGLRNEASE